MTHLHVLIFSLNSLLIIVLNIIIIVLRYIFIIFDMFLISKKNEIVEINPLVKVKFNNLPRHNCFVYSVFVGNMEHNNADNQS
jgi:hypothetical protein